MTTTVSLLEHPALTQMLTRLGLATPSGSIPDLEDELVLPLRKTLLPNDGARQLIRYWADGRGRRENHFPPSFNVISLTRFRDDPAKFSTLFGTPGFPPSRALALLALDTGHSLHQYVRKCLNEQDLDLAVNAAVVEQQEFLFAASSGLLEQKNLREALGKYAVSMAQTSSWHRYTEAELRRAVRYQEASISLGNQGTEAWEYLIDLNIALFDATGDDGHLATAQALASEHSVPIREARALLKIGLAMPAGRSTERSKCFREARDLADRRRAKRFSARAEQRLLVDLALAAQIGNEPLAAREVRLPLGFIADMPAMAPERVVSLVDLVRVALGPARRNGRLVERSIIDRQVLTGMLTQALSEARAGSIEWRSRCADELVTISRELSSPLGTSRYRRNLIEALLIRATVKRTMTDLEAALDDLKAALDEAVHLSEEFPASALVALTWARVLSQFDSMTDSDGAPETKAAWEAAVRAVVASPEYRRKDLGGRSAVFALDDAKGELATTFIFKPLGSEHPGDREREQLEAVARVLATDPTLANFAVPTSIGIFSDESGNLIHVLKRSHGRTLQDLDKDEVIPHLPELVRFLAVIHKTVTPPHSSDNTWKPLREYLRPWARGLVPGRDDQLIDLMKAALPDSIHPVRKRDAHLGNWLIDEAGRLIAIDLDSPKFLPAGHDFAQLIEDWALLPISADGFSQRYSHFNNYLSIAGVGDDEIPLEETYDWFALYRSIWIGTATTSSKAQHQHSRELAAWIAAKWANEALGRAATMVSAAMNSGVTASKFKPLDHHQRRISKAIARVLRHSAPELGLHPDAGGFVPIEALSVILRQPQEVVTEIANHPGEPRFQVEDGMIRALYGHSFPVLELNEVVAPAPEEIFHGTAWASLDSVLREGLQPRKRQNVHLTTNESEALEVGRRHGAPVLLAVRTSDSQARLVADAIWSAPRVDSAAIRIVNPFAEIPRTPAWLEVAAEQT